MPRISARKMDKEIETEMFKTFWQSLGQINNSHKASEFFSDLLTTTEQLMLAKRFTAAIMMIRGKTATEIKESINLSYTTTGSIASWVKNAKPKTREILVKISNEKSWEKILDRIEEFLDKLPPAYGTNWSEAGRTKHKRAIHRSVRKYLR
jgi:uncharacterized protein YerC